MNTKEKSFDELSDQIRKYLISNSFVVDDWGFVKKITPGFTSHSHIHMNDFVYLIKHIKSEEKKQKVKI